MNTKQRIQSLKDYLKGKEGKLIRVIYQRPINNQVREYSLVGKIKRIKHNRLTIILNDDKTLGIGMRVIKVAYLVPLKDSLRIRYKLYYKTKRYD
jgi:hypothetical protein